MNEYQLDINGSYLKGKLLKLNCEYLNTYFKKTQQNELLFADASITFPIKKLHTDI